MKKWIRILGVLALLSFSGFAYAESFNEGGKSINYNIPDGYVKAQGPIYAMLLNVMQQAMPPGLNIKGIYLTQADDETFRSSNGNSVLNNYLVITTMDQLAHQSVSAKDFKEFKRELKENHGLLDDAQEIANERINEVFNGQIQIGNIQTLGCFGETDTELSYIIIMEQQANVDGKMMTFEQVLVFTGVLTNERLVFVNQYRSVENEAEVKAFQHYALDILNQMNFASTESVEKSGMVNMTLIFIVIIIVVIVVIIVVFVKRKNRDGNTIDINRNGHTRK